MSMQCLKRFDWGLAARIRQMGAPELAAFLSERLPAWRAAGWRPFSDVLKLALGTGRPVADLVQELLDEGCTLTELRNDAVYDLCLQGEDVALDPRGAWAELLEQDALSSLDVLPGTDEELFLLLRPQQLDAILQDRTQTQAAQVEAVARLRDACAARPGMLIAYCFEA